MKRLLLPLLAALALPTVVHAGISDELHKKCLEARDCAGCVTTNKNISHRKDKEITGIGIRLFINSDTVELTIQSVINNLPADVAQRYKKGLMWIDDLKAYEDAGFTGTARTIRDAIAEAQTQKINNETRAMQERNDKHAENMRNRPKGMRFGNPLPAEQVEYAKRQWGITGLADWQK